MKKFLTVIIFMLILSIPVSADGIYDDYIEASGFKKVYENSPKEVQDFFKSNNFDAFSPDFINSISAENLFSVIFGFLKGSTKLLSGSLATNIAILLLWAIYTSFSEKEANSGINVAFTVIMALSITMPIIKLITATGAAIKSGGVFMLSFLPVFFSVTAATGAVATAGAGSFTLLMACEITVQIIAFAVVPIASAELALAISGILSSTSPAYKLSLSLKRASSYIMTFTFTVFLGLLSLQTTINSAADTLSLKTLKFVVGSFVPVAGTALSETVSTLGGSIKILQNGIGVYGIVAILVIVLPTAAALIIWRLTLFAIKTAADMLGINTAAALSTAIGNTLSLLLGILIFTGALFIISLAILIGRGI